METLNVVLKLNEVICHDEGDGWGSAEPYFWTIFFKIDGLTVWQNGVTLGGEAAFSFGAGSHSNLPNHDVPGIVGVVAVLMEEDNVSDCGAKDHRREGEG